MRHRNVVGLCVLVATSTASAETQPEIYFPGGMMLLHLDDDGGKLQTLVGKGKQGVVRCYVEADGYDGIMGASGMAVTGCYVGIARTGKLVAPPAGKKWGMRHMLPYFDGSITVGVGADSATVDISGVAANAIALWANCESQPATAVLQCREATGMLGKFGYNLAFDVTKGGAVRAPKQP
jgi:hypothetical protein